jgi:hypothetical protein
MNGAILAPKLLSCSVEEAKNNAAENALIQLGIQITMPSMQINEFYPPNLPQSQASLYQGRPLSAAHGVNLNGTNSTINGNNNSNNNNNNTNNNSNASLNTPSVQNPTNRPQNIPVLPDYLPIMTPYYFDPSGKKLLDQN